MVFKNFRLQIIIRVVILTLTISAFAWCLVNGLYLRGVYLGIGILIIAAEMIWYTDRFNRDVKTFMISLQQRDFTTHYQSYGKGKSFDSLYEVLNQISAAFKTLSSEKEIQHRYLEMLIEHVRVSILSVDAEGKIHLANQAVKDLLHKDVLLSLKSLEALDRNFVDVLREIRTGETRLMKLRVKNNWLQLSIHASEFKLDNQYYKLISMQNISNELDAREMEAWQKLIGVLSHEIMNSVSPIISLSATLHALVSANKSSAYEHAQTLDKGLEAIKIRSEGLYNFTQTYRQLTGIPKLSLREIGVMEVINRVSLLMDPKMKERQIAFTTAGADARVTVDPELIEQVLINLLLNAIEAVSSKGSPHIEMRVNHNTKGVAIHIVDNGEGMDEVTAEKIFIPFFTTRKNGSGIGLAITKQILQLHHADIHFETGKGKGTEFVIQF
jgi:nitrogen fixation/metabolism regulation signal transduction histidine kinase